jgi:hypothetical protein
MVTPHGRSRKVRQSMFSRLGSWLRGTLRREQALDPQLADDERRKRGGELGENIENEESAAELNADSARRH